MLLISPFLRRLSPLSSLSYLGRDDTYSKNEVLGLGSNNAGAEGSPVLTDNDAELPPPNSAPCAENAKINVKVIGASQEMCSYLPLLQKLPAALVIRKVKVIKHNSRVSLD